MKRRILFVCLGNICRSPLAEAIFNQRIKERSLEQLFESDSCGTGDYHIGQEPDPRTWACAAKNKVHMQHLGRQIRRSDLYDFDYVLAMDRNNFREIKSLAPDDELMNKVHLMRSFENSGLEEVPDPYYGDEEDFQKVFEILDRSIERFIAFLLKEKRE